MNKLRVWFAVAMIAALAGPAAGAEVYPLAQVKRGQSATVRTCLEGRQVVEFPAEVLGVLEKSISGYDVVLIRLSGAEIERTGPFSGMSGSPVYIDGKLMGALAYSFPYTTDPVAGVTPFEQMRALFGTEPGPVAAGGPGGAVDVGAMLDRMASPDVRTALALPPPAGGGEAAALRPIGTPLMLSGCTPAALEQFRDAFRDLGFVPVLGGASAGATGGAAAGSPPLAPGAGVVVTLVRGDIGMGAGGTVTEVDGETVYAFGHPFLQAGRTAMPLHDSEILAVVRNLNNSFKFFTTGQPVGAVLQDRLLGIMGRLGARPELVPVAVTVETPRKPPAAFAVEVVRDPFLTPFLINYALFNFLQAEERAIGAATIDITAEITLAGGETIPIRNVISSPLTAAQQAALFVAVPLQYIFSSGYKELDVTGVSVKAVIRDELSAARIDSVQVDRAEVRAGETVNLKINLQLQDGRMTAMGFPLHLPADLPAGPVQVFVGDGTTLTQLDRQLEPGLFTVSTARQLVGALRNLRQNATVYVKLYRKGDGIFSRGHSFPALPASWLDIFSGSRTQGASVPLRYIHFLEKSLGDQNYVITGAQNFQLDIRPE